MNKARFQTRSFTSMLTGLSFAAMGVSGVMLFVVPQGRIAEWTGWQLFGLGKSDWGNIHITTSLLFLAAAVLHTWYNWEALVRYFSRAAGRRLSANRETLLSIAVLLFFVLGAVYKLPPLASVLALNGQIKESWIKGKDDEPPVGHAELLTVKSFIKKLNIDPASATEELNRRGIAFTETESLALIAKRHGIAPVEIYRIIRPFEGVPAVAPVAAADHANAPGPADAPIAREKAKPPQGPSAVRDQARLFTEELVEEQFEGRGVGRKTLSAFCEENGLDAALARKKLAARQLAIKDGETFKEASERLGTAPIEILKILMVGEPLPARDRAR